MTTRIRAGVAPLAARCRSLRQLFRWTLAGRPYPPPHWLKQRVVRGYARRFDLGVFVETGTYLGDMVQAVRRRFATVYSIELAPELYERARKRFAGRADVHIAQGDSTQILPRVLESISSPALFWLDAHASGGPTVMGSKVTPVVEELQAILSHAVRDHVVLIDDARGFDGTNDYPTLDELRRMLELHRPEWVMEVAGDIIRMHPARGPAGPVSAGG